MAAFTCKLHLFLLLIKKISDFCLHVFGVLVFFSNIYKSVVFFLLISPKLQVRMLCCC